MIAPCDDHGFVVLPLQSAAAHVALLQAHGAAFPVIPAITNQSGIDAEPGYRQIYAVDNQENGVVFTQDTGD